MEAVDVSNAVKKKYGVPAQLTLGVKEAFALKCTKKKLTFESSSPKVAKVSAKGVVTALKKGKATITVYSNKKKLTTCAVTVVAAPKKVTLSAKKATLGVKEKLMLVPQITKNSHTSFTWTVKNKKIATVSKAGVVTGVKAGKTTVTVKTHNGKKATLNVTVVKAPKKVSFNPKAVSIGVKEQLAVEPVLTAGSHASLTWSVKNKKIATVSQSGVITGKKAGKTTVTVKTHNGKKATLTVTVVKAPTKVKLNKKKATLQIGDNLQLKASFPKGQASKLIWTSSALTVAYVDENGLVTALSEGSATVTVTAFNGKKAICAITVKAQQQAESTQDSLSRDLEMLEQLDENPASIGIEEMTFEKLSTEGIEDKTLLKEVKAFNSAQSTLEKEIDSFNTDMDKMSKRLASLDSAASDAGLQLNGNKLSVSGIGFGIDLTNMEKIDSDAEILSVKASSNDNSISIEVKSGGKKYTIVSDRNGVRVLTGSAANAALAAHKNAVTSNAIAVQNGFWSSFGDAVMKGVRSIETGLGYIREMAKKCVEHAEEAFDAAEKSFKNAEILWEVRQANPNEPEVHMIDKNQYLKAKSNMNAAKGVLESARNFKKIVGGASLPLTIKTIYEVNKNIIELGKVGNHHHPTALEKQNAKQRELAGKLKANLATAEIALGISGCMAFNDLATQLNDFLFLVKLVLGPAGLVASLASVATLKVTKALILGTAKKMGVQLAIDAAGNAAYKEVMDLDKKLHNIANIRGKVIDKDTKKPLSGVEVSCPDYGSKTTDSNGKFEFKDVFGGEYEISFDKKGYEHTSKNVTLNGIDAVLDVVMEKSVSTVKGTVYDKDTGKTLSGVSVSCEGCDTVTTDANGKYTLEKVPVGKQEIRFVKKAYKTVSKTATVNEGKETSLDAQMEKKSGTVKGKVYDNYTYTPIEGVSVSCEGCDTVTTNAKGEYTLEKVPVGEQEIRFVKKGYATVNKTATVNEGEETSLDAEMEKKVGTVKGTVFDADTYTPIEGVSVSCEGCDTVTTDDSGIYILENVPAGEQTIRFVKEGYAAVNKTITINEGIETTLDAEMEKKTGTVTGTVYDKISNEPLMGVNVSCEGWYAVNTGENGRYTLENVPAGEQIISFEREGYDTIKKKVMVSDETETVLDLYMSGDHVTFGHYDQDNDPSNGKEPIEWLVLEDKGDMLTLISLYALDFKPYNTESEDVTWATCTLRSWLNGTFLNAAFTSAEQSKIQTVRVVAEDNPYDGTEAGSDTYDKVWLLSIREAENLFSSDIARECFSTPDYLGPYGGGARYWWLRSPGASSDFAAFVLNSGYVNHHGDAVFIVDFAVRPVICLRLS